MLSTSSIEKDGVGTHYCIVAYRDNTVISAGHDTIIRFWNINNGKLEYKIKSNHSHLIKCLAVYINNDDTQKDFLITGSWDSTVNVFTIDSNNGINDINVSHLHALKGHKNRVKSVCTGTITNHMNVKQAIVFSGSDDNTIIAWDILEGVALYTLEGHTRVVIGLDYLSSMLVSSSADKTIRLWMIDNDTKACCCTKVLSDQTADITCVLFAKPRNGNNNGNVNDDLKLICSGNAHGIITIYNAESGDRLYKFDEGNSSLSGMSLYYQNSSIFILATTHDGCLMSWDINSSLKGPFYGKLAMKEEVNDGEDTFYWDKRSNEDSNDPTYVLHSICCVNNDHRNTTVVAGADGLLLFFSISVERECIPASKAFSRKARNIDNIDDDDDDVSISSTRSKSYNKNNPHIYKNMRSNKLSPTLSAKKDMTLPLGKPSPLSSSRMQQLMSSIERKGTLIDDDKQEEGGLIIIHDEGQIRLRDNNTSHDKQKQMLESNNRSNIIGDDYLNNNIRYGHPKYSNRQFNDDNMRLLNSKSNNGFNNNDTKTGIKYIKKGNGEMIPVQTNATKLNEIRMSRVGRILQPQPILSASSMSSSIYYDNNNNNEYMDKQQRHHQISKVVTNTINLRFEEYCGEKNRSTSTGKQLIKPKRLVKVYLAKH